MLRKKSVLAGIGLLFILLVLVWSWLLYRGMKDVPDVGGSLEIQVEPGMRVFLGDRLMGSGGFRLGLADLLKGGEGSPAVELPLTGGPLDAEFLSGPGARSLKTNSLGKGSTGNLAVENDERFLRRADGTLDQVFAIVLDLNPPGQNRRRLFLPLRVRAPDGQPPVYITTGGSGFSSTNGPAFVKFFGKSPQEWTVVLQFRTGVPPQEFGDDYKNGKLWEPMKGP
jgi:hypothetical protein